MQMKKGFLIYNDLYESIKDLSFEDKGQIFDAILRYSNGLEIGKMSSIPKTAFNFIKQSLDRDNKRYEDICIKNKENIKNRWNKSIKPSNKKDTTVYDRIRPDTKHTNINININNKYNNINIMSGKYLSKWNEVFKTTYTSTKQIEKPLSEWIKSYSIDEICKSIDGIKNDPYWRDKDLEPLWLLRFRDKTGDVDRIGKFLNTKPELKLSTHLI
jgi:hypothetical protein